jgi:hypothetical protein
MAVVQMAMLAGLPYTALRDAILTPPPWLKGSIRFFQRQAGERRGSDSTARFALGHAKG